MVSLNDKPSPISTFSSFTFIYHVVLRLHYGPHTRHQSQAQVSGEAVVSYSYHCVPYLGPETVVRITFITELFTK